MKKENFWDPVKDIRFSRIGWTVTHPRWSPVCRYELSFQIYKNHEFVRNGYRGEHDDDVMYQLAWNMGIRQGRIEALTLDNRSRPDLPASPGNDQPDQATVDQAVLDYATLAAPSPPLTQPALDPAMGKQ